MAIVTTAIAMWMVTVSKSLKEHALVNLYLLGSEVCLRLVVGQSEPKILRLVVIDSLYI